MLYVDTSVLVALCTHEAKTADVLKQRTRQLT
jgi:predicted nucleic acid-binding protein